MLLCDVIICFQYCKSKLTALEVMLSLSKYVTADIILDRLVPFMVRDPARILPLIKVYPSHAQGKSSLLGFT